MSTFKTGRIPTIPAAPQADEWAGARRLRRFSVRCVSSPGNNWAFLSVCMLKRRRRRAPAAPAPPPNRWYLRGAPFKALALTAMILLTGCRADPTINLVGSFFPAWMLCVAFGVIGVLVLRRVFVRTELEPHLGPVAVVYFCLWVLLTLGSWLLIFRS